MHAAYLGANVIIAVVWILLYLNRRDLRKEMLVMSLCATPLALFDVWFVPSYWEPITLFDIPVGIEGFIYSFGIGGIASVMYAEVAHRVPKRIAHWHRAGAPIVIILSLVLFFVARSLGAPNPMVAAYVALLAGIALTIYFRKDLVASALVGALTFGLIYFLALKVWVSLFPEVNSWFVFDGLPRTFVWGVPLWEALFGLIFAAYWGNLYELLFGYRLVRSRSSSR